MSINEFARVCVVCAEAFWVEAHYLVAVVYELSGFDDAARRFRGTDGVMKDGTLAGFGTAFNSARAAGTAGTEIVAFSRLLTRFAQEIALALWRKEKLGAAISAFRRRLLVAGNPLAFVFQALGGAGIHLNVGK